MALTHKFVVRGNPIIVANGNVIGVLALLKLEELSAGSSPRVYAIKFLRQQTGLGLLEAKLIVDFLYEKKVVLDRMGEPVMPMPQKPDVEYGGAEDGCSSTCPTGAKA